ncbi:hypothetical protein [Paractinoplanes toevensis]|nr:hypothetical protein [Actinoplanes toevensis]
MPERLLGADGIDWAALMPAGPPAEIPACLRVLRSAKHPLRSAKAESKRRRAAYERLSEILVHQGSRSPASAAAVPFLVAIVTDPAIPDRFAALDVLRAIATGDESYWLIEQPDAAAERVEVARLSTLTVEQLEAEQDAWIEAAPDEEERQARARRALFADVEDDRRARQWDIAAYDAVRAHAPAYAALLDAEPPADRIYAAYLLAWFPEERATALPGLRRMIEADPDPIAASVACVAAGLCAPGTEDETLVAALADRHRRAENRAERWSAAIGLARVTAAIDPDVRADLAAAAEAPAPVPHWPFLDGDIAEVAALTLLRAPEHQ